MTNRVYRKINSEHGVTWIHVILAVAILVMLTIIAVPVINKWKYHGEWLLCADSLRVVNGALTVDYLMNDLQAQSLDDSEEMLVDVLPGREGYCPTDGTIYFVRQEDDTYKAVCGEHDSDHALRTRLNASYVLSQLRDELLKQEPEAGTPEELMAVLNGGTLRCSLALSDPGIRRGTGKTRGYSGTIVFYGIDGVGDFEDDLSEAGSIVWFCFADEDHNAIWSASDGWSGSAYGD